MKNIVGVGDFIFFILILNEFILSVCLLILRVEMFFIVLWYKFLGYVVNEGLDVFYRGGKVGFVKVEGNLLIFFDFSGNKFFNILGNILLDLCVGLCFWDNEIGDFLFIKVKVSIEFFELNIIVFEGVECFVFFLVFLVIYILGVYFYFYEIIDMFFYILKIGDWK